MRLEHQFTVAAPVEVVWAAVINPERVAPCMPGATLTETTENEFRGTVKVKLGPISLLYKGSGQFVEVDEQSRQVVIKATGKDSRGNGTASATVTVTLRAEDGSTHGEVLTDLAITGKPAQFGRGMISEVGGKILDTFAANLAEALGVPAPEPAPAKKPATRRRTTKAADKTTNGAPAPAPEPGTDGIAAVEKPPSTQISAVAAEEIVATSVPTPPRPQLHVVREPETEAEPIDLLAYAGDSMAKRALPVLAALLALFILWRLLRRR